MITKVNSSDISVSKWGQLVQNRSEMFDTFHLTHLNLSSSDDYEFLRYSYPLGLFASSIELGLSQDTSSNSLDLILGGCVI